MIEINNLSVRLSNKKVLDNISFRVEKGDFLLVIGKNGAGKTTLLKTISHQIRNFQGKVLLDNKDIKEYSQKEIAKRISFISQIHYFTMPISVREVILSGRYPYKGIFKDYGSDDFELLKKVSKRFGVTEFLERDINSLSSGEMKRVLLSSSYIQDIDILILDEPFTFLDPSSIVNLINLITELNNEGKTIIIVSHNFEMIFNKAKKVLALSKGKKVYYGEINDISLFERIYNVKYGYFEKDNKKVLFIDD